MCWFAQIHPPRHYGWLAMGFISLGISLEILQEMVGYRFFEYGDILANSVGVFLSWGLAAKGFDNLLVGLETFYFKRL